MMSMMKKFLSTAAKTNEPEQAVVPKIDINGEFIGKCSRVHRQMKCFIDVKRTDCEFVSLGENCSTSWYLKSVGLKNNSYPFDWILSSPDIALDCIKSDFKAFLDKRLMLDNGEAAGHRYYHTSMFNHRNPLKSNDDYEYYVRSCERFLSLYKSNKQVVFVITLINEPEKRPVWANGFTEHCKCPENQTPETVFPLIQLLKKKNDGSKFVIVDHYTNSDQDAVFSMVEEGVALITFKAAGVSTGIKYTDPQDDFCYKLIMAGANIDA